MSCDDGLVVSSSSITTVATTGSHVLKINGYSTGKLVMINGSHAESCEFEAAGHTWRICYYPNGFNRCDADHISLMLRLVRGVGDATIINAWFRFSLVVPAAAVHGGKNKNPQPYRQTFSSVFGRTEASSLHGFLQFIKREELEKSEYLVDDCFAVRCDIDVVQTTSAPGDPLVGLDRLPCRCSHLGRRRAKSGACRSCNNRPPTQLNKLTAAWFRLFGCGLL